MSGGGVLARFWFKEFIDHRDPHLLGPPLRFFGSARAEKIITTDPPPQEHEPTCKLWFCLDLHL